MNEEVKKAISEKATKFWESQANRDHHSKMMKGKNKGNKHGRYRPFTLIATLPKGDVSEHVFDGDCPSLDCVEELGLSSSVLTLLRNGDVYEVKRRKKITKHEWPIGTIVTQKKD